MRIPSIPALTRKYFLYLQLISPFSFVITFLIIIGSFYYLDANKYVTFTLALFISFLLNPPIISGTIYFVSLQRYIAQLTKLNYKSIPNIDIALSLTHQLKEKADLLSQRYSQTIYVAYLLFGFSLRISHPAKHVNPTNTQSMEMIHQAILNASEYFQNIEEFVMTYLRNSSIQTKKSTLEKSLKNLPSTLSRTSVKNMVVSTHKDGAGFLSTLFTLYDLFLCSLLPDQVQVRIVALFEETVEKPERYGWLSHRFFEYIVVSTCTSRSDTEIKNDITAHIKMYRSTKLRAQLGRNVTQLNSTLAILAVSQGANCLKNYGGGKLEGVRKPERRNLTPR